MGRINIEIDIREQDSGLFTGHASWRTHDHDYLGRGETGHIFSFNDLPASVLDSLIGGAMSDFFKRREATLRTTLDEPMQK